MCVIAWAGEDTREHVMPLSGFRMLVTLDAHRGRRRASPVYRGNIVHLIERRCFATHSPTN
jgi:hypothetical protein